MRSQLNRPRTVRPSPRALTVIALWSFALGAMPAVVLAGDPAPPITLEQAAGAGPGWPIRFLSLGNLLEISGPIGARNRWTAPMSTARLNPVSLNRHGEVRLFETASWPRPGIQHGFGPYAGTRFDRFSLYHNSTALWSNDALGPGWTHWGDIQVHTWREAMGVSRAAVLWGNGSVQLFEREANRYRSLDPYRDTLSKERGQFVLTLKSGMVVRFQSVRGVPTKSVVASLEDPNGNTMTFAYDGLGRLARITDPHGRTLDLIYDPEGRLSQVVYGFGGAVRVCDLTYEGGELRTVERPFVIAAATAVAGDGSETRPVERFGGTLPGVVRESTTFGYDMDANIASVMDDLGNITLHEYIGNKLRQVQTALGNITHFESLDGMRKVIDPRGVETELRFVELHGLTEVVDGAGASWRLEYMDPRYPFGWSKLTLPLGDTVERAYDESANPTIFLDRRGNEWESAYDASSRLAWVQAPLVASQTQRATTWFDYDTAGNLLAIRQNAGGGAERVTSYTYDAVGNRTSRADAGGGITTFEWNGFGNMTKMIDPEGRTFEWGYQSAESTNLFVRPDLVRTGEDDLLLRRYNENGQRVVEETSAGTVIYARDAQGRVVMMTDPTGVTERTYDADGRLTSEVKTADPATDPPPATYAVDYEYFPNDLPRQIAIVGTGRSTIFEYDAVNRIDEIVDGSVWQRRAYDAEGRVVETENSNGTRTTYDYDGGLPVEITHFDGAGTPFAAYHMDHDAMERVTRVTELDGSATSYEYDLLGRLIGEERSDAGGSASSYRYQWVYDANGDRVQVVETVGPTTVERSFVYAADGRPVESAVTAGPCLSSSLAARTHFAVPCDEQPIEWDENGNLSAYTPPGQDPLRLFYDALGRRDRVEQLGLELIGGILYDGDGRNVAESIRDGWNQVVFKWSNTPGDRNGSLVLTESPIREVTDSGQVTDHTVDPSGSLVATTVDGGSPVFPHTDYLGFFRQLTDGSGTPVVSQPPRNGYGELTGPASSTPVLHVADRTTTSVGDLLDSLGITYSPLLARPASVSGEYAHGRCSADEAIPLNDGRCESCGDVRHALSFVVEEIIHFDTTLPVSEASTTYTAEESDTLPISRVPVGSGDLAPGVTTGLCAR